MHTALTPAGQLNPQPSRLIKKPGNPCFEDFQPSNPSFQPTNLSICKCTGFLQGQGVVVTATQHIWALIKLGSYGKGIFSRSVPCHHHIPSHNELKQLSRKRKSSGIANDRVLEKWTKRIKLHSQWRGEHESVGRIETQKDVMGALLGFSDSEDGGVKGDDGEDGYKAFLTRLKSIWKTDPYVLDEYLQLGAEETFYLVDEVNALVVTNIEGVEFALKDLWLHFSEQNPSFPVRYAAYRHFRIGNWVPKSGLKFGVDFLLYKEGPLFYHSNYAVVVRKVQGGSNLKWKEVTTMNRASEAARKDLLVCDVTRPPALEVDEIYPAHIDQMTVTDTVVKRWIPKQDRDM